MAKYGKLSDACAPVVDTEARVLLLGEDPHGAARACWPQAETSQPNKSTRYALVVVFESSGPAPHDLPTLAAARDQWANQVLVLTPRSSVKNDTQTVFLGLGFRRRTLAQPLGSHYIAHGYAISNYKSTPDWLNNRFWANPGQWDKN